MKLGVVYIILGMISLQFGASLAKKLFGFVSPIEITALRITIAALLMWVMVIFYYRFKLVEYFRQLIQEKSFLKSLVIYSASLGLMNLFFYLALQRIPLGLAVSFEFVGPLGVAFYFSKSKNDYFWVILAILGLAGLFSQDYQRVLAMSKMAMGSPEKTLVGTLMALIAGGFWGFYIIFGKKISHGVLPTFLTTTLGMTGASVVALIAAVIFTPVKSLNMPFVLKLSMGIACLSSLIPYSLEMMALKKIKQNVFGLLMSVEPVVASAMGYFFLNETLNLIQKISMVFVIIACAGITTTQNKNL